MARYNREFLVPYLQNVCALHLVEHKISNQLNFTNTRTRIITQGLYDIRKPTEPDIVSEEAMLSLFCAIICSIASVIMLLKEWDWLSKILISFFLYIPTVLLWLCFLIFVIRDQKEGKKDLKIYNQKLEEYARKKSLNEYHQKKELPSLQAKAKWCENERKKVNSMLQKTYSANIIPRQYRNIYAAVYLYDWFSTSRMDDLDMALNTFVLEEIKEKLDIIIENQSEMILNQCLITANQRKSLAQQQQHADRMYAKLNQISASNEERNCYLSMIESNTAATAYFAAADYIRNL